MPCMGAATWHPDSFAHARLARAHRFHGLFHQSQLRRAPPHRLFHPRDAASISMFPASLGTCICTRPRANECFTSLPILMNPTTSLQRCRHFFRCGEEGPNTWQKQYGSKPYCCVVGGGRRDACGRSAVRATCTRGHESGAVDGRVLVCLWDGHGAANGHICIIHMQRLGIRLSERTACGGIGTLVPTFGARPGNRRVLADV